MKLLAVISHKGGVGKTTSAVLLAEELAAQGYRTLLVDADRQQGAGLLLEVGTPTGEVQRTRVAGLDYLGSARLTDAQVAQRAAAVADRYDMGIVDTPSLDDSMARAWLQQATAALMILQVEPLTVKTFPNALQALDGVRHLNPLIELVGLLPTMFDPSQETHRTCLTELLTRRPESVFTPVVPVDAGLMHRAAGAGAPEISVPARQSYQCAADRITRMLNPNRSGYPPTGAGAPQLQVPGSRLQAGEGPAVVGSGAGSWEPPAGAQRHAGAAYAPSGAAQDPVGTAPGPPGGWPAGAQSLPPGGWPAGAQQYPPQAAHPGYPAQAVPPGYAQPSSPSGYPAPAGHPGYPPQATAPSASAGGWPAPAQEGMPATYPAGGQAAPPQPTAMAGGAGHENWDRDRQDPDWWQAESEAAGRADSSTVLRRPARSGSPATFALGFAAACILLLLAWAGGAFRRVPMTGPQTRVPGAYAAPRGEQTARGAETGAHESEKTDEERAASQTRRRAEPHGSHGSRQREGEPQ
jgi:chromosome partitioning protein